MKNWKRMVCAVLCAGMLLSPVTGAAQGLAAVMASAEEEVPSGTCGEGLTWKIEKGESLSIDGTGAMDDYLSESVPWEDYQEKIRYVTIGSKVTHIGDHAFLGCAALEKVSMDHMGGLTSIGEGAFYGCTSLRRIGIPDNVTEIGALAFSGTGLLAVSIPDGVEKISYDTFMNCTDLLALHIGSGVTLIGSRAFCNCPRLETVILPESVKTVGTGAFSYCKGLRMVYVVADDCDLGSDDTTFSYLDDDEHVRFDGLILGSKNGCAAEDYAMKYSRKFSTFEEEGTPGSLGTGIGGTDIAWHRIRDQITFRGTGAMEDHDHAVSMGEPDWSSEKIRSAVIGEGITTIGDAAFMNCSALGSVEIPTTVTSIGNGAFYNCKVLKSFTVPAQVRSIGVEAFMDCSGLESITILNPDCEISAADDTLPQGVTVRGYPGSTAEAYAKAHSLTFEALTSDKNVLYSGTCGTGMTWKIDSMNTLTISGTGAVTETPWLEYPTYICQVIVEEDVTSLPDEAFRGCRQMVSVKLPDSLQSIGTAAFWMCVSLNAVTIPAGVTALGYEVFYKCDRLPEFRVAEENTAYTTADGVLYTKDKSTLIAYPKQKTDTSFTIPDGVKSIQPAAFSENPYLVNVTLPDTVEEIMTQAFYNCLALQEITASEDNANYCTVDGVLYSKDKTAVISYPMAKEGTSYTIPDGVTAIGAGAFAGVDLTSVTIPDGVTKIDMDAFYNCMDLTAVTLPETLTTIGDHAFTHTGLTEITVPLNVEQVGYYAFYDCDSLKTATFRNSDCDICNDADTLPKSTVLRGYADSSAQLYAEKYGRTFEEISDEPAFTLGDVNLDGAINAKDANEVLLAAARLGTGLSSGLTEVKEKAADVTGEGTINAKDASLILRYAAIFGTGKVVSFEELNKS